MPKKTKRIKKTDRHTSWARRTLSSRPYRQALFEVSKSFLVVCEGQNTEPDYFKSFPLGNAEVQAYGLGQSKTALVESTLDILKKDEKAREQEVWVVFDFDVKYDRVENQKEDFNNAVLLAEKSGLNTAYSNDCFELWFWLHFAFLDSEITRKELYQKLGNAFNCNYEKSGKSRDFSQSIYNRLEEHDEANVQEALKNAERLEILHREKLPADKNPYTSVYKLVAQLLQYVE